MYAGGGLAVLYFSSLIMKLWITKKALRAKNKKKRPAWVDGFIKKMWYILLYVVLSSL